MTSRPPLVPAGALEETVRDCLVGIGLSDADGRAVAEVLVDANLRGEDSHGFARLPIYMQRVHAGLAGGTERVVVTTEEGAVCRLDAGHALGPAVAVLAVDRAMALASAHGIGLVAVGRSTHFGVAGFYARRAAQRGFLAIVLSNGPANMAPHGASERFLGTNPLAIAAPLGSHGELVLDMSSSVTARGKIIRAKALGEPIAPGLAIDSGGAPTVDPAAALAGAVLPAAGPKGSGLALAITVLTAVLAGADFDDEVAPMYGSERPQNVGHVFIAIDPRPLAGPDGVDRVEPLIERLHALRPAAGGTAARFPGEGGARRAEDRRARGIPLAPPELEAVATTCDACGLPEQAARVRALQAR